MAAITSMSRSSRMSFRFHFDADKAIQAIGVLMTHEHVSQMNSMRVLKLLYLAERE